MNLWSWIVALACCFINMLMFGMSRLSGVLFVASVSRFNISREKASMPYTLAPAVRNTAGPLVGYLGHKFGVRLITSIGCLIAATGIGCCYLAESIELITVLWGIIFGLGFGLGNILLPIAINQHFSKRRATASGISFSGACIGSFVFPPIVEYLINNYGLSQTFIFLSGFVLNCLPAALLLRKPKDSQTSEEQSIITCGKEVKLYTVDTSPLAPLKNEVIDSFNKRDETIRLNDKKSLSRKENIRQKYLNDDQFCQFKSSLSGESQKSYGITRAISHESVTLTKVSSAESMETIFRDNSTYSRSCEHSSYTNQEKIDFKKLQKSLHASLGKKPFGILTDPVFILIALTNAVYNTTFVCMLTVLVDFAKDIEVEEANEKYILMSFSVGDLIGRLFLGSVTDNGYMTRSHFAAACFFFQGVTTTIIAWSAGFTMLVIMAALYGLSEAGIILIIPLTIAEFIEEEKQTVAIPTSYFLTGPLCLTVAPLIGFFREGFGTYDFIFYGIGILSFICSIFWLMIPYIARRRKL